MVKNLLLLYFIFLVCTKQLHAQNNTSDSLFLKNQSAPMLGDISIKFKNKFVLVSNSKNEKSKIDFDQISHLKFADGKFLEQGIINKSPELLVLFIHGRYSLLYHEKESMYYVRVNDTLKVISREYIKRALPLIFGQQKVEDFYASANLRPQYTTNFLKKLVTFANSGETIEQIVYEQNLKKFKTVFYIGPYTGVGLNRTAFNMLYYVGFKAMYEKTKYYKNAFVPLGFELAVGLGPKIKIELNTFWAHNNLSNFSMDSVGTYKVYDVPSYVLFKKFDPVLTATSYTNNTLNFDLAINYSFLKRLDQKFHPYIVAGPSIVIMSATEIGLLAKFNNDESSASYNQRWYRSHTKDVMIALNLGGGISYKFSKQFSLNIYAKYQQGRYPRILITPDLNKEINDTPEESSKFGPFETKFQDRHDLHSKIFQLGASLLYKF